MVRTSPSAHQASYDVLYTALRRVLREGMQAGPGAEEGINSLQCRVTGALYALLAEATFSLWIRLHDAIKRLTASVGRYLCGGAVIVPVTIRPGFALPSRRARNP